MKAYNTGATKSTNCSGANGSTSYSRASSASGPIGSTSCSGDSSVSGAIGANGISGATKVSETSGATSANGAKGATGPTGAMGPSFNAYLYVGVTGTSIGPVADNNNIPKTQYSLTSSGITWLTNITTIINVDIYHITFFGRSTNNTALGLSINDATLTS
jgi:hypothetical protein